MPDEPGKVAGRAMRNRRRRVIVQTQFERTLWSVLEALAREGFTVRAADVGAAVGRPRGFGKYVLLEATHRAIAARALESGIDASVLFPARVAIYELTDRKTAVVPDPVGPANCLANWMRDQATLAAVAREIEARMTHATSTPSHGGSHCLAVA